MLLSNRRDGLIYFCLAGMEAAWFTPVLLFAFYWYTWDWSPLAAFGGLFGALLAWMLVLELLNRLAVDSPLYELSVLTLILLTSLLIVRFWLYPGTPVGDLHWLGNTVYALFNFDEGVQLEWVLILVNLFLWQRAISATSRTVTFFRVGFNFRMGILLLIASASLLSYFSGQSASPLIWVYFGLGLTAVALARVRDKAIVSQSVGRALPPRRLAQVFLSVGLTVGIAAWLSLFYTLDKVKALLRWSNPLWTVLERVLWWAVALMLIPLEPLLLWLIEIFRDIDLYGVMEMIGGEGETLFEPRPVQPSPEILMFWTVMRYIAIGLVIVLALGFVLLYLKKIDRSQLIEDAEEESEETITLGGGMLNRGVQWLRDVSNLVKRYGLSRQLLAAISVQNIYANLCRIANRRGYPRHRAQPPDDYLPTLNKAFRPEAKEALSRITWAYMRVHYGDKPIGMAELTQLQRDYHLVRLMKPHQPA
ncbi:MAG: DUF4129 domain-containing protein [Anaerolineales bacterium]|nr:MAG: DUF4129 domain-containing protein [Anaerolineales bacterium]